MDSAERPTVSHPNAPPVSPDAAPPVNVPAPPAEDGDRSLSETTRFRVVSLHASGGMGNVFVAEDDQLHRSVALKEIQERFADDRQIRERFLREAEVTGQLEHPGIVPVYALGHADDGRPYYVMRMIRGDSLRNESATWCSRRARRACRTLPSCCSCSRPDRCIWKTGSSPVWRRAGG